MCVEQEAGLGAAASRGAAERRENAQPCAAVAEFVLAQDAGRRRTVVSSGEEPARAEHE